MSIFRIEINAGTPAVFDPNPQTVFVNDSVFWFNNDPNNPHWPAPSATDPQGFLEYQVTPDASSNQVTFGSVQTIPYICVNHPGETGKIIVKAGKKTAFAGKTKKGAFAGKTKKGAFGSITK
jgi:plastocyanin